MSFPNIPDINPKINITFEDSINLLLTSIAMEEISLSKLMDAETQKISCVLGDCMHNHCDHGSVLHDAVEINKSVDGTIKDMIKLQMLLQFKLDNIKDILPTTSSTTTTSTSTSTTTTCTRTTYSTTTTTHTSTCTTSTCSTTTKNECYCGLTGNGIGCVTNCCDEFCGNVAELYAFVHSSDAKCRTIRYSVKNEDSCLQLVASDYHVKMQCPGHCSDKLVIYGKGYVRKHSKCSPDIADQADFILTVHKKIPDVLEFRMEIKSDFEPNLNHDSWFVQVKSSISDLCLIICC